MALRNAFEGIATEPTLEGVRNRLPPMLLDVPTEQGDFPALGVRQVGGLSEGAHHIGFTSDAGILQGALGHAFVAGTPVLSTSSNIRVMMTNPSQSGRVAVIPGFVVSHDEGATLIPVQIMRDPQDNLPTTLRQIMNLSIGGGEELDSLMEVYGDTGSAMGGGEESVWVPTTGNVPVNYALPTPAFLWPGTNVGLNFNIGGFLSGSGDGMVTVLWVERTVDDINAMIMANGGTPVQPSGT